MTLRDDDASEPYELDLDADSAHPRTPPLPIDDRVWVHPSEAFRLAGAPMPPVSGAIARRNLFRMGTALTSVTVAGLAIAAYFGHADTKSPEPWAPSIHAPAWLGISVANADASEPDSYPCVIVDVAKRSPAWNAGLRPDDQIVSIDDENLEDVERFLNVIAQRQPGDEIDIRVERSDGMATIRATLTTSPTFSLASQQLLSESEDDR